MNKLSVVLVAACAAIGTLQAKSPFAFRDNGADALALSESGKAVFVYNYGMVLRNNAPERFRRSSYFHPVYAPNGTVVTDDFPKDHFHHRGLSWMWPVVRVGGEKYDLWAVEGIHDRFVRWIARETGPKSARLAIENGWFVNERKVVKETVDMTVHPANDTERTFDLVLKFEATDQPVEIAGTHDQNKGYGGLSFRFAPRENTVIRADKGTEARDTNMVPHPWAELEGTFQGKRAAVRIEDDPSNPEYPNGWCLRHYGFLGVNYPGLKTYTLEPGKPLVLRYQIRLVSR